MVANNLKHSIWNLIFSLFCCILEFIGVFVGIIEKEIWLSLGFLLFAGAGLYLLVIAIVNVQWVSIYDDKIVIQNIFGVIKEIEYMNINKAFKVNATIFSLKVLEVHKKYIVLSNYKSLQKSQILDAYNRSKYKYLMIPFSIDVEIIIKAKYKKSSGADLEIN